MTVLELRLHQPGAYGALEVGAIANVLQLTDASGNPVERPWRTSKSLGVSGGDGDDVHFTSFSLPAAGRYGVNVVTPRGNDITLEYALAEGEDRKETVRLQVSPHEYLGWQQFAGLVAADPYSEPLADSVIGSRAELDTSLFARNRERQAHLYAARGGLPTISRISLPEGPDAWTWAGDAAQREEDALRSFRHPLDDWSPAYENMFCTWFREMPDPEQIQLLIEQLRTGAELAPPLAQAFPRWVLVDRDGHMDLASIPWVWWGMRGRREGEDIRLLFDRVHPSPIDPNTPGRFIVSVQDSQWGGLLEFVASGRMTEASEMADQVFKRERPKEALYGKLKGPLTAVLGGIVLISRARTAKKQHWDDWLRNLASWFPGIPDGEILLGYRLLQRGRLDEGLEHLHGAMARGIPYFTASIRMLSLGLAQMEDEANTRKIASVAAQVDPTQPFTVIRTRRRA